MSEYDGYPDDHMAQDEHLIDEWQRRQRAAQAVKQAFPTLLDDFTDQWFDKLVDIVVDTYLGGSP